MTTVDVLSAVEGPHIDSRDHVCSSAGETPWVLRLPARVNVRLNDAVGQVVRAGAQDCVGIIDVHSDVSRCEERPTAT